MTTPANHYWSTEGTRFLNPDSSIPTVEERVKAAFEAGREYEKANQDNQPDNR